MSKIGFLFSGQGAQYVGMGKELFENNEECRSIFKKADEILGFSISDICFEGPAETLNKTEYTQPAILTTSIAALKALEKQGIKCSAAAGLSLGEYSALVCSGALKFEAAVEIVHKRGKFMEEAVEGCQGTMAAIIGLPSSVIEDVCKTAGKRGIVEISNYNCPGQIVIGGEIEAVKYAAELLQEKGAKRVIFLNVSGPFHTSMLKSASDKLFNELNKISFNKMNVPVITNVTGNYLNDTDIINTLKLQVMSSVRWEKTINTMIEDGYNTFVEIGPSKVLSGFVKKINRKLNIYNVEDIKSLENTVKGILEKEA